VAFEGAGLKKTDNNPQAFKAKVDIRRRVLEQVGKPAAVFDAFAGSGEMFTAIWSGADRYVGCDLKYRPFTGDCRMMFAADNRRVMRAIDLRPFNVFDLDAYGNPWEQAIIIADRRPVGAGELLGLAITEGNGLSYKGNVMPHAIRMLTGLRPGIVGLSRKQDDVITRAIAGLAKRMRCDVVKRWQAEGRTGASMRYIGLVLRGRSA
jgi:hypothetical protein